MIWFLVHAKVPTTKPLVKAYLAELDAYEASLEAAFSTGKTADTAGQEPEKTFAEFIRNKYSWDEIVKLLRGG